MAAILDTSLLTLNPKESTEFQKFIFELAFNQASLSANHRVWTGLTMKEQIRFCVSYGFIWNYRCRNFSTKLRW